MKRRSNKKAFTMVELMISVMLASMIIGTIVLMIGSTFKSRASTMADVDVRDTVKFVADDIARIGKVASNVTATRSGNDYTLTIELLTNAERDAIILGDPSAVVNTHAIYKFTAPKAGKVGGELKLTRRYYSNGVSTDKEEVICDPSDVSGLAVFEADVVTKTRPVVGGGTETVPAMLRIYMSVIHSQDQAKCIKIPVSIALRRYS